MSTTATEDYVAKRAELLAHLVLTRQQGVQIVRFQAAADVGLDLIVSLPSLGESKFGTPVRPSLGVEVKGTDESLETEDEATAYANRHWKDRLVQGFWLGPVVLLLFSTNGDKGYFSWIMEPKVTKEGPTLVRISSLNMTKITKTAIEAIFRESEVWSKAMYQILLRDKK